MREHMERQRAEWVARQKEADASRRRAEDALRGPSPIGGGPSGGGGGGGEARVAVPRPRKEWSPPGQPFREEPSAAAAAGGLTPERSRPGATPELTPEQRCAGGYR